MNKTITFLAKDLEKKMRLDKFLTENLKNLSRSQIKKIIISKNIKINKKQIIASSEKIKENDLIEVNIPEKKTNDIKPKKINLDIIYEDEDIIVITHGVLIGIILKFFFKIKFGFNDWKKMTMPDIYMLNYDVDNNFIEMKRDNKNIERIFSI